MAWLTDYTYRWLVIFVIIYLITFYFIFLHKPVSSNDDSFLYRITHAKNVNIIIVGFCLLIIFVVSLLLLSASFQRYQNLLNSSDQLLHSACLVEQKRQPTTQLNNLITIQEHIANLQENRWVNAQRRFIADGNNSGLLLADSLWNCYVDLSEVYLAEPLQRKLEYQLATYIQHSTNDAMHLLLYPANYEHLKAYLMLSNGENVDAEYLSNQLSDDRFRPQGVDSDHWHEIGADLIYFYANHLQSKPKLARVLNEELVSTTRHQLIQHTNFLNSESAIYQRILKQAYQNYDSLSLRQMLRGVDSQMLFISKDEISGIFTRQAWEGYVQDEIEKASINYDPELNWVLGEQGQLELKYIPANTLKRALTDRYFTDYFAVWHYFLNDLRWRNAFTIDEAIDQLRLLSDRQKSPFIALMDVIQFQGEIQYITSPTEENDMSEGFVHTVFPAETEFGKVLHLFDNENMVRDDDISRVSLQEYLDHVTRSRTKLVEISELADPVLVAQEMTKTVFQGKSAVLSDTRNYGKQIAVSLGDTWENFGNNMFIQPIEQAWQAILEPAVEKFNLYWQSMIAEPWNAVFFQYYPVRKGIKDLPLAELSRYLKPNTGTVEQFIKTELSGVLKRENGRWIQGGLQTDRLRFHPQFLQAINRLSIVSDSLPANGSHVFTFDIYPRAGKELISTELVIDEQKILLQGNKSQWQTVKWPGDSRFPAADLQWETEHSGKRRYDDMRGSMALIRLLEKANINRLDNKRHLVSWKASDGNRLEYEVRTERGAGPIALLQLKGLSLPMVVFERINIEK